jgi:hypothetical protein
MGGKVINSIIIEILFTVILAAAGRRNSDFYQPLDVIFITSRRALASASSASGLFMPP